MPLCFFVCFFQSSSSLCLHLLLFLFSFFLLLLLFLFFSFFIYLFLFFILMFLCMICSSTSGTEENRISELKSSASSTLVTTTTATTEKVEQQQQSVVVRTTTVISSTAGGTISNETVSVNSTSHTPNSEFFPFLISCIFLYSVSYQSMYCTSNSNYFSQEIMITDEKCSRNHTKGSTPLDHLESKFNTIISFLHILCSVVE